MSKSIISADSHITEPPDCYTENIASKFRETAPYITEMDGLGDVFVIDGMPAPIPLGLVAAAGLDPKDIKADGVSFTDLHRSGWDPKARKADQERDGIAAEIIYPTVGMVLCNHPDVEYKQACMQAYNRWLQGYCEAADGRVFGLGQTAVTSVESAVHDLEQMQKMGFIGVMMPGEPGTEFDYDDPRFDALWEAAVGMDMPLSFHILTSRGSGLDANRGPKINAFLQIIRGCQDVMGMFIYAGVFDRHPKLKLVCAEADAGWVPHYMYRMDHAYEYHRYWMKAPPLERKPSEYFRENIAMTFQDDYVAFQCKDMVNVRRLMWASDFPHSDSTWPRSQQVLADQTANLTEQERDWVCHDNVAQWYGIEVH
ncbi:MAG: amidohydrolase [Gammaproteobacteria bacterium]|nr:amidohydrolase [Gammaproteobacteria bacterium]